MLRAALLMMVLMVSTAAVPLVHAGDDAGDAAPSSTVPLKLHCKAGKGDVGSMSSSYVQQGCWAHLGMHRYVVSTNTTLRLHGGSGRVKSVEQQLSPPSEPGDSSLLPPKVRTPIPIEVSEDGRTWTRITDVQYTFAFPLDLRQAIEFTFDADGEEFRYLRIREPRSAAQGLSGYIDHSRLTVDVSVASTDAPANGTTAETRTFRCQEDILEDVFAEHPCWYGGIDRWDAASWFHTYPIGDAEITRLRGTFQMAYFRPDDPGTCCGQSLLGVADGKALIQASDDGASWTTVAEVPTTYGEPTHFDVPLADSASAHFVRIVSDKHPGYWNHPALKHPEAYLVQSDLLVTGLFAT